MSFRIRIQSIFPRDLKANFEISGRDPKAPGAHAASSPSQLEPRRLLNGTFCTVPSDPPPALHPIPTHFLRVGGYAGAG